MFPLVWFDLRHNFLNYRAITELFTNSGAIHGDSVSNIVRIFKLFVENLIGRYMTGENIYLTPTVAFLVFVSIFRKSWSYFLLAAWLGIGLLGLSFYQKSVYDHYLGFLNPAPFLLLGSLFTIKVGSKINQQLAQLFLLVICLFLVIVNFQKSPLLTPPNNQLERTQKVAKFIIGETQNQDFNFALLSKNNYDAAYQFYLSMYGHTAKQVPADITEQLFVVCEDSDCQPINNPKYEIAGFGWSKVEWEQEKYGVKIYKLIHNLSGQAS